MKKRNRIELVLETLEAVYSEGGINPTKISLKVNLSYDRVKKILNDLIERGLVKMQPLDDRKGAAVITLTPKGVELLLELKKLKSLLEDYGLL
ncbi:MAG: winged helix-turn-helix domain-containing protein [Desulfurococcaceae archaeon]